MIGCGSPSTRLTGVVSCEYAYEKCRSFTLGEAMAHAPVSERFTAQRRQLFLATLAQQGNVQKAAKAIKISSRTCYNYRKADPLFAQAWDDAIRSAMDTVLEPEAMRRAVDGVLKPVYQGGELVGHIREYSDTLLIFLLKGG